MCFVVAEAPEPVKMILPVGSTVSAWQALHAVAFAATPSCVPPTPASGGSPWQLPQVEVVVVFHCQVPTEPCFAALNPSPWQYVLQEPGFASGSGVPSVQVGLGTVPRSAAVASTNVTCRPSPECATVYEF